MAPNVLKVYQFKITLLGPKPKIWRRIQVPDNYSFYDLHVAIQDSMGWKDYHLHRFEMKNLNLSTFGKVLIGIPDDALNGEWYHDVFIPEVTAKIAQHFLGSGNIAHYRYDFGMEWEHEVLLEKILPAIEGVQYPICITGKMACPPEDGVAHAHYNPGSFNPASVKFDNPEERWVNAFQGF